MFDVVLTGTERMDVAVGVVGLTVTDVTGATTTGGVTTPTLPELLIVAPAYAVADVLAACNAGVTRQRTPPNTPAAQTKSANFNGK